MDEKRLITIMIVVDSVNDMIEIARRLYGYRFVDAIVLNEEDIIKVLECLVERSIKRLRDIEKLSSESRILTTLFRQHSGYYNRVLEEQSSNEG